VLGRIGEKRRVQEQGIQSLDPCGVCRLIYLSEKEFEFIKVKRLEFLKRAGYFLKEPTGVGLGVKDEGQKQFRKGDLKVGRDNYTLGYEPSNIGFTRDSLFWSWRRVKEYYQELREEEDVKLKELKRLMGR